jgi:hypothetical protein
MRIQTGSTVFSKHDRGLTFFNKGLEITDIMRYNPSLPLKKAKTSREGIENRLYSIKSGAI